MHKSYPVDTFWWLRSNIDGNHTCVWCVAFTQHPLRYGNTLTRQSKDVQLGRHVSLCLLWKQISRMTLIRSFCVRTPSRPGSLYRAEHLLIHRQPGPQPSGHICPGYEFRKGRIANTFVGEFSFLRKIIRPFYVEVRVGIIDWIVYDIA